MKLFLCVFVSLLFFTGLQAAEDNFLLRTNLQRAQAGDYIVTAQNKNFTLLLVHSRNGDYLNVEELTIPSARLPKSGKDFSWRQWVEEGAYGNTCHIIYPIYLPTGSIQQAFSFTKNDWISIPQSQNFLSTLLSLQFSPISINDRKKIGPTPTSGSPDHRSVWQPPLIVDGKTISGAPFNGWRTRWPNDGSDLAGKNIEIYLPSDSIKYPAYFPYWLQISGLLGKAKVRIVDSGSNLKSTVQLPQKK